MPCVFLFQQVSRSFDIPGFNINEATDVLLKRDFDEYENGTSHPFDRSGLNICSVNDRFELWTQSLHFGAEAVPQYEETNLK